MQSYGILFDPNFKVPVVPIYLDRKEYMMCLYLDLKKAFDKVNNDILLWKENNYNILE
jgi:hypothetical protein